MTTFIIKVILCSGLFILTYKMLLEGQRMHRFNRFFLLAGLLLSFVVPMITFSSHNPVLPFVETVISYTNILPGSQALQEMSPAANRHSTIPVFLALYIIITAVLFFRLIRNLKKVFTVVQNNLSIPYKNARIVLINERLTPHSFFNFILLNKDEYYKGSIEARILIHELCHVQQKHSFDIMVVAILKTFFWFNPFIFLYLKSVRLNHEFLADEAVINSCQDICGYQALLIEKAYNKSTCTLTSQLNYLITKKRLIMMTKSQSFSNLFCRKIALVPVLALSVFLFSTKSPAQGTGTVPKTKQGEKSESQAGVSVELLQEYDKIVDKAKNEKGFVDFRKFSDSDKERLESIFLSMNKSQQAQQAVVFTLAPPPFARLVPTGEQIERWKNENMYGLWINNKRVRNAELSNYKNEDFAHVFVSKLEKNAINYGKHYYQVDLMTTEEYDTYYKKAISEPRKYRMGIRVRHKQG